MSGETKQVVADGKKQRPRLRSCFRFTLRTLVLIVVVAAFFGWLAYLAVEIGADLLTQDYHQRSYRTASMMLDGQYYSGTGKESYANNVQYWYQSQATSEWLVHRDAVDLIMRRAKRLDMVEECRNQLPRITEYSREGDTILVFEVADDKDGSTHQYAFLLRDDILRYSAEKAATDTGWVEKSKGAYTNYVTRIPVFAKGAGIMMAMLIVLTTAGGVLIFVAFVRYIKAWLMYLSAGPETNKGRTVPARSVS